MKNSEAKIGMVVRFVCGTHTGQVGVIVKGDGSNFCTVEIKPGIFVSKSVTNIEELGVIERLAYIAQSAGPV